MKIQIIVDIVAPEGDYVFKERLADRIADFVKGEIPEVEVKTWWTPKPVEG